MAANGLLNNPILAADQEVTDDTQIMTSDLTMYHERYRKANKTIVFSEYDRDSIKQDTIDVLGH